VNDYEIVVAGLAAVLAEHADRLVVMDATPSAASALPPTTCAT
jgi:hypothetical protein